MEETLPSKILELEPLTLDEALNIIVSFVRFGDHGMNEFRDPPDRLGYLKSNGYDVQIVAEKLVANHRSAISDPLV